MPRGAKATVNVVPYRWLHAAALTGGVPMGDSSPKQKNKQKQQDKDKKKNDAANAAAKQAPAPPPGVARKGGR
jgi:hypothetical protein